MNARPRKLSQWLATAVALAASWPLVAGQSPAPSNATTTGAGASTASQGPAFRADVDLVSLNVTVTDHASHYVTDLQRDDFDIYEDGVKQEVRLFNRTSLPIGLALLLDSSASMENKLPTAQEAAIGFTRRLRKQDLAAVIDFDSRVTILQNFTNDRAALEHAIRKTTAGGSTSLYTAIYVALKDLKKTVAANVEEIRRQAIIVLSDGEDTSSLLPFEDVLDLAKRSETAIFCVGLRDSTVAPSGTLRLQEADFVLRQLAQQTGGRTFFPNQLSDLTAVYGQISEELSSQYTLGYTSHNLRRDGAWRRIAVRLKRPNVTPRTRQGYFGPKTAH
jgi:Ca-activated chloride channel homolog